MSERLDYLEWLENSWDARLERAIYAARDQGFSKKYKELYTQPDHYGGTVSATTPEEQVSITNSSFGELWISIIEYRDDTAHIKDRWEWGPPGKWYAHDEITEDRITEMAEKIMKLVVNNKWE